MVAGVRALLGWHDAELHSHFVGKKAIDLFHARFLGKINFLKDWDDQIVMVACGLDPLS